MNLTAFLLTLKEKRMANQLVWVDIPVEDLDRAIGFYSLVLGARDSGKPGLVLASLAAPMYWALMSLAAVKSLVQLVSAPSFWEKTVHGLDRGAAPEATGVTDA